MVINLSHEEFRALKVAREIVRARGINTSQLDRLIVERYLQTPVGVIGIGYNPDSYYLSLCAGQACIDVAPTDLRPLARRLNEIAEHRGIDE